MVILYNLLKVKQSHYLVITAGFIEPLCVGAHWACPWAADAIRNLFHPTLSGQQGSWRWEQVQGPQLRRADCACGHGLSPLLEGWCAGCACWPAALATSGSFLWHSALWSPVSGALFMSPEMPHTLPCWPVTRRLTPGLWFSSCGLTSSPFLVQRSGCSSCHLPWSWQGGESPRLQRRDPGGVAPLAAGSWEGHATSVGVCWEDRTR